MTINEAQDEVIEEFNDFTDWMDKYQLLIDLGGELNALGEQYKNDDRIGLKDHLSPTRSNGLLAMVKRIKSYALVYANA